MSITTAVREWQVEPEKIPQEWPIVESEPESDFNSELIQAEIESAQDKLTALADNWDGEGSAKYNKETLNTAAEFLMNQSRFLRILEKRLPIPQINPGPDGSIDLFWNQSTWELLVNIPSIENEAASFYGEDQTGHTIKGSFDTSETNFGVITWLMK